MRGSLTLGFALAPLFGSVAFSAAGLPAACSMVRSHFPIPDGAIAVLARATADTVVYPLEEPPGAGEWEPDLFQGVETVVGQRFVVLDQVPAEGSGNETGDSVSIVPWAYDSQCRLSPWDESALWVAPDSLGFFFRMDPIYESHGTKRFDVFGWMDPYPQSAGSGGSEDPPMSAAALFDLNRWLYEQDEGEGADLGASLLEWAGTHPEEAEQFPVARTLRRLMASDSIGVST